VHLAFFLFEGIRSGPFCNCSKSRPADPFCFRPSLNGPNFIQLHGPGDPLTFPRHQNISCRMASTAPPTTGSHASASRAHSMLLLRRVLLSSAPSPRALLAKSHRPLRPPETLLPSPAARRIEAMASAAPSMTREAFRAAVNNTLERRFFFVPSFKIYGGVAGLYDYGPPGCAVKANVLAFWRQVLPRGLRCGSYFRCLVCWFREFDAEVAHFFCHFSSQLMRMRRYVEPP
jgi:hypothetical protein